MKNITMKNGYSKFIFYIINDKVTLFSLVIVIGLLIFMTPNVSIAFPETVRHGYLSCVTCHLSPSGRGQLTPYGKTLSHELYSYIKIKNENESLESEVPWWQIGGRTRLMQLIEDTPALQEGHFFPMQTEVEGSIDKEVWAMGMSLGAWRSIDGDKNKYKSYLRNAYLLWRPNDNWNARIGKFRISHGLGLPDHVSLVNEGLGWSHSHETENIEVSRLSDDLVIQGYWVLPSELIVSKEKISGLSFNIERMFNSIHKIGMNISSFKRGDSNESQINVHSVASVNEKTFVQLELVQRKILQPNPEDQVALWTRFSREMNYGLRPFIQIESAQFKESSTSNKIMASRFFVGTEWFPLVHTDIFLLVGNQKETGFEDERILTLIGHFYF